jgi:hypothetical protein
VVSTLASSRLTVAGTRVHAVCSEKHEDRGDPQTNDRGALV